jgi:hypothetical protein
LQGNLETKWSILATFSKPPQRLLKPQIPLPPSSGLEVLEALKMAFRRPLEIEELSVSLSSIDDEIYVPRRRSTTGPA